MKLIINLVSLFVLLDIEAVNVTANRHHHLGHPRSSSCTVDGISYENGTSWPSQDGCQQCSCSNGLTFCVPTSRCPELGQCGISAALPGRCCPVCIGCVSPSGRRASFNETWQEDECTTCTCHEGIIRCQMPFCSHSCLHPRRVPGECCPVCDDDCTLDCQFGRQRDANTGRELCQCRSSSSASEPFSTTQDSGVSTTGHEWTCPHLECSRTCPHGLQTDRRGCPVCKCRRCKTLLDCHKNCPLGLVHDFRGCPLCQCQTAGPKCHMGNSTYAIGERWKVSECVSCSCHKEGPMCTETVCVTSCSNPIYVSGQCCPLCSDINRSGPGNHNNNNSDNNRESSEGTTLLTAVLVCIALVAGLTLIIAVLALCVARQCNRLRKHEENVAAAVRLTSVSKLRPKSTNLEYQYNLYMKRYGGVPAALDRHPGCWNPMEQADLNETRDNEEGNSQCSNSPLLVKMEKPV